MVLMTYIWINVTYIGSSPAEHLPLKFLAATTPKFALSKLSNRAWHFLHSTTYHSFACQESKIDADKTTSAVCSEKVLSAPCRPVSAMTLW